MRSGAVLAEGRDAGRKCAVGSVKTNIGHLEAAAGIAGLIKTALALHHRAIPPSLHFSEPNPHVDLRCPAAPSPVQARTLAGERAAGNRGRQLVRIRRDERAPGHGGGSPVASERLTWTAKTVREPEEVVFPLSARSPAALWALASSFRDALADDACDADLRDLAYTAGARRGHHDHRLALVVSSRDEIVEALDSFRRGEPHLSSVQGRKLSGRHPRLVFVFSGLGGLWQGAGRALFRREPVFRAAIERCDAILSRHLGWSPAAELTADKPSSRIGKPEVDRPVQFTLQVALAALWESWGIVPSRVVGDGIGEVAAAYVAGNLSLEDAARIAAEPTQETSRFPTAMAELANEGFEVFLEVGPHPVLASTIKACLGSRTGSSLILASSATRRCRTGDACDGRQPFFTREASTSNGRGSRPLAVSFACRVIPGNASGSGSTTRRIGRKSSRHGQLDRDDAISIPAPHQNGRSNGHHAAPAKRTSRSSS